MLIGDYKASYAADESIFRSWPMRYGFAAMAVALVALPFGANSFIVFLAVQVAIYTVAITGLNILTGYTGLISLGHGALVGVGAYATAIFGNWLGLPFWVVIPMAVVTTAVIGLGFGLPSLRIRGLYLTIATLAASFIIIFVIEHWKSVTNGDSGITLAPASVFGIDLVSDAQKYALIVPIAVLAVLFAQNLFRTRVGRAFLAIRDSDYSAEIIGVGLTRYKLLAFALGSAYAGLAGSLWAYNFLALLPTQFELQLSIIFLAALVVGGSARTLGPVFGAVFVIMIPEFLKWVFGFLTPFSPTIVEYTAPANTIAYGLLIIVFMIFEPMGLAAIWTRFWRYINLWPFSP